MQLREKQQGMTAIGWIVVLGLIAFFAILTLRLLPNYLEFFKVSDTLESLEDEPNITRKSAAEIRKLISRRFYVNDVENMKAKDVEIVNDNGRLRITADYEVRVPVLGNVDAVTKFNKSVELIRR